MDFQACYNRTVATVENAMETYLAADPDVPDILSEAMSYSLHAGGKRLRPVMLIWACTACGGEEDQAAAPAAAIEMIHTYSLIHDDLPAMDNDDLRRGKPTCHKVFGDGIAVLAGDALLTYAFDTVARYVQNAALARQLIVELSHAGGGAGMIAGQAADMINQNSAGSLQAVKYIHTHKTAMMFRAAARMGALCARTDACYVDLLGDYGLKVGLAFQIIDDLLDITSTAEELGKDTGKDQAAGKLTYPAVLGLDASRREADCLITEALASIGSLGPRAEPLRYLTRMLIDRKN